MKKHKVDPWLVKAVDNAFKETMSSNKITELINRRRRQILVHSCIYYRLNDSIITDAQFDKWAYELAALQKQHPDIAKKCVYAEYFKDFDGSTGFNLPVHLPEITNKACQLLNEYNEKGVNK